MKIRDQRLVHDPEGLNTGTWPLEPDDVVTPVEQFFTRSHAPIPSIDADSWRLQIGGMVGSARSFSLDELLHAFRRRTVTATLVCAGLRRNEFLSLGPLPGELPWGPEPASTGEWTGILLGDLLRKVGIGNGTQHVELIGLDQVERRGERFGFGGSIELTKALADDVLLATHLNGASLPPKHGYPLRAVVPGWIGARSVKWLGQIRLREDPSSNYFQSQAYRMLRQIDPADPRDVSAGVALSEVPVNAVVLQPVEGRPATAGRVRVQGWAMGSGGRTVVRVELSLDGRDWTAARMLPQQSAWAWTFWEAFIELDSGRHTLAVRATDSSGATQPESVGDTWNVKGYNNNAWHRVVVNAE